MAKAKFLGVYSTRGSLDATGSKIVSGSRKQYWFVWQDVAANTYLVQQLDGSSYEPLSEPRLLPSQTFRQGFSREPRITLLPAIQPSVADYLGKAFAPGKAEAKTLVSGVVPPGQGMAKAKAQRPDELDKALRAEFAANIMRFRRGNLTAVEEFKRMSAISEGIVPAHKHMFTDFGMDLRKSKLHDVALICFARAVELSPGDSHAHFNLGRIYFELGKFQPATEHLNKALALDSNLECAQKLLQKIKAQLDAFLPEEF